MTPHQFEEFKDDARTIFLNLIGQPHWFEDGTTLDDVFSMSLNIADSFQATFDKFEEEHVEDPRENDNVGFVMRYKPEDGRGPGPDE